MASFTLEFQGLFRLVLAIICGALIGLERERGHRPAGLRTHTLVCLGACLVVVTSFWIMEVYGFSIDPMRMGAQVISGIGFLGAGTIIKAGHDVRGLTTAACLWIVACIGLAIGAGNYVAGIGSTALTLLTLFIFKLFERGMRYYIIPLRIHADTTLDSLEEITDCINQQEATVLRMAVRQRADGITIKAEIRLPIKVKRARFMSKVMQTPGVVSVSDHFG